MDKGMKRVVDIQLRLECQLKSGVFPTQGGGTPMITGESSLQYGLVSGTQR